MDSLLCCSASDRNESDFHSLRSSSAEKFTTLALNFSVRTRKSIMYTVHTNATCMVFKCIAWSTILKYYCLLTNESWRGSQPCRSAYVMFSIPPLIDQSQDASMGNLSVFWNSAMQRKTFSVCPRSRPLELCTLTFESSITGSRTE